MSPTEVLARHRAGGVDDDEALEWLLRGLRPATLDETLAAAGAMGVEADFRWWLAALSSGAELVMSGRRVSPLSEEARAAAALLHARARTAPAIVLEHYRAGAFTRDEALARLCEGLAPTTLADALETAREMGAERELREWMSALVAGAEVVSSSGKALAVSESMREAWARWVALEEGGGEAR